MNETNNSHYKEYLRCKQKYLELKNIDQSGGKKKSRHECKPTNKYNNICIQNDKGYYKSKESCINDCENKYINHHLIKSNIKGETVKFYLFIKDIIKNEKINVYIKGGNVIGLYILKMIYNEHFGKNKDKKFKKAFNEFLKLGLMKDWDFAAYCKFDITQEYRTKLDKIAKKYKLVPRAKTFILYQTYKPILIDKKALFEIAILDSDAYSTLELPMTTMKVKVHEHNLKYIFMFAKSFLAHELTGEEFDFDILKKMIRKINVIVHPHKNGLYDPGKNFDNGGLSDDLIHFIDTFSKEDKKLSQFIVIHLQDPYRLLYRFPEKNVPKTDKIKSFIKKELPNSTMPSWLMDTNKLSKLTKSFAKVLGEKLRTIYTNGSIDDVNDFMSGVKFGRTQIEYDNFTDKNKKVLNLIFKPLLDSIRSGEIDSFVSKDKNDIIKFIKFMDSKR